MKTKLNPSQRLNQIYDILKKCPRCWLVGGLFMAPPCCKDHYDLMIEKEKLNKQLFG